VTAQAKKDLLGMLEKLRDGTGVNGLAWVAAWLLQTDPSSRYGDVKFEVFEREAGPRIALAVREGLGKIWRNQMPMFNQSEPRSTYNITVAGLQGLHLELGDGKALPKLTRDEVRNAIKYGMFEINGYPRACYEPGASKETILPSMRQANAT
jgi:hypothetical protein